MAGLVDILPAHRSGSVRRCGALPTCFVHIRLTSMWTHMVTRAATGGSAPFFPLNLRTWAEVSVDRRAQRPDNFLAIQAPVEIQDELGRIVTLEACDGEWRAKERRTRRALRCVPSSRKRKKWRIVCELPGSSDRLLVSRATAPGAALETYDGAVWGRDGGQTIMMSGRWIIKLREWVAAARRVSWAWRAGLCRRAEPRRWRVAQGDVCRSRNEMKCQRLLLGFLGRLHQARKLGLHKTS